MFHLAKADLTSSVVYPSSHSTLTQSLLYPKLQIESPTSYCRSVCIAQKFKKGLGKNVNYRLVEIF